MEKELDKCESSGNEGHVCERLYKYSFQNNEKFMQGWNKVRNVIPAEKFSESLLKAKVFFYSRECEPVSCDSYKQWLKENNREIDDEKFRRTSQDIEQGTKCDVPAALKDVSGNAVGDQVLDTNKNGTVCCSDDVEGESSENLSARHPGNFMELVEMLQKGMTLPNTDDLNIEPLNEEPTPCDKQRPKKPWEET